MTRSGARCAPLGIGPTRRKRLLTAFGSVSAIKKLRSTKLRRLKGMTPALAAAVKTELDTEKIGETMHPILRFLITAAAMWAIATYVPGFPSIRSGRP